MWVKKNANRSKKVLKYEKEYVTGDCQFRPNLPIDNADTKEASAFVIVLKGKGWNPNKF